MRRAILLFLLVLLSSSAYPQTYDAQGRLTTTCQVTNTSATVSPVSARLTDGSSFIVPCLDATLTARFPTGSTPADGESNAVTTTRTGAFLFASNGTTWDRLRQYQTAATVASPYGLAALGYDTSAGAVRALSVNSGGWLNVHSFDTPAESNSLFDSIDDEQLVSVASNGQMGFWVTAISSPNLTVTPYATGCSGAPTLVTKFRETNGDIVSTVSSFAVGDYHEIIIPAGVCGVKIRVTSYVSGTVNVRVAGTNAGGVRDGLAPVLDTVAHSGFFRLTDGTDTALVSVSGSLMVDGSGSTQPVSGPLTDTQLRATAVPVSGTFWQATQPVSGTVTVQQSTASNLKGTMQVTDGTNTATVRDTGTNDSLNVAITDASGGQITSFGGGTQYTEGDTDATIVGTAAMWEDTGDTLRAVSAAKPLPVNVVAGGAGDGSILDGAAPSIKATVLDYTNSNPLAVRLTDTSGDYVGAGAGTQYAEDTAHASGDIMTMAGVVQQSADSALSTDGDRSLLQVDGSGFLKVYVKGGGAGDGKILDGTGAGQADVLGSDPAGTEQGLVTRNIPSGTQTVSGTVTANAGTGTFTVGGTVAATQSGTWSNVGVTGTFWQATQPVSGTFWPTTAASPSSTRLSDGAAFYDAAKTGQLPTALDGSGFLKVHEQGTATVSGTVTANAGTGSFTVAQATPANLKTQAQITDGTDTAIVSGTGSLQVTCDNCGGSSFLDNGTFTGGSTPVTPFAAIYDTTPPSITDGSAGTPRMSSSRVLLVDGSGSTQPVSGTFWQTTQPVSGTVIVSDGTNNIAVDTSLADGEANTGNYLQTRSSVYLWNGTTWDRARGLAGAMSIQGNVANGVGASGNPVRIAGTDVGGTVRQLIADTDGHLQSDVLTLPANASVNLAQVAGASTATGNGTAAGSIRVSVASDSTGSLAATQATASNLNVRPDTSGATGAAPPARADYVGGLASGATGGFLTGIAVCDSFVNINVSTATTTLLVTGVTGRHVRICSISIVVAAAQTVALISGTGATCGTGTTGMNGGTTAATGWSFAANGGLTQGSGIGAINQTNATGDSVCIVTGQAAQTSGRISYTIY